MREGGRRRCEKERERRRDGIKTWDGMSRGGGRANSRMFLVDRARCRPFSSPLCTKETLPVMVFIELSFESTDPFLKGIRVLLLS